MMRIILVILSVFLASIATEAMAQANFRVVKSKGVEHIVYNGTRYELKRPRKASDLSAGAAVEGLGSAAFVLGLTKGDVDKKLVYECILWNMPSLYSGGVYRSCQTPGQASGTEIWFPTPIWNALDSELKRRYPNDSNWLRSRRSVFVFGRGAASGSVLLGGRQPYLWAEAWLIVGHDSNDYDALEDILSLAGKAAQIYSDMRSAVRR